MSELPNQTRTLLIDLGGVIYVQEKLIHGPNRTRFFQAIIGGQRF